MTGCGTEPARPAPNEHFTTSVAGALRAFHQASQAAGLYDPEHPSVRTACEQVATHLRELPEAVNPLLVGVLDDGFVAGGTALPPEKDLTALMRTFREHDVAAIEFDRNVDVDTIHRVAVALRPGAPLRMASELRSGQNALGVTGVRLIPVNYGLLRCEEGGAGRGEAAGGPMWISLQSLARLSSEDAPPEEIAKQLNSAGSALTDDDLAAAVDDWRSELHEIGRDLEKADETERVHLLRRLSDFLSNCHPRLRRALLPAATSRDGNSFALLEALLPVLPLEEVLDALEHVDHEDGEPSPEAIRLYQRLARVSRRVPAYRTRVEGLLASAGPVDTDRAVDGDTPSEIDVRPILEELLTTRSSAAADTASYGQQLDQAAFSCAAGPPTVHDVIRAAEVRYRAAEIAVSVIGASPESEPQDGPFDFISRVASDLVQADRLDLVVEASRAASRRMAREGAGASSGSTGAQRLIERSSESRFVQQVLDRVCAGQCAFAQVLELLKMGGAAAMSQILLRLASDVPREVRTQLQDAVLAADHETLLDAVRRLARSGDDHLQSMFAVLNAMSPQGAVDFLQPLCTHREAGVRRLAFHALANSGWVWPHRLLEHALKDSELEIFDLAIQRLEVQTDALSTELLEQTLGAGDDGRLPEPGRFRRLAALLLDRADGPRRLAGLLESLRSPLGLQRAARARRLALMLRRHRKEPEVRRALRRWLLSPAPLLGLIPAPADLGEDEHR